MVNHFRFKALPMALALAGSVWALADELPFDQARLNHWAYKPVQKPAHVHDIHATILHLMGLNQFRTAYKHNGRMEVPTLVEGRVIKELVS